MTVDEMLCRWAERKYEIPNVTQVTFEFADDGPYSEVTPGDGPYIEVRVTFSRDGVHQNKLEDARYDTALIREILEVAAS